MNYPFLYQRLDVLNVNDIKKNLVVSDEKTPVWDDWQLLTVESSIIREFLIKKYPHLKIFRGSIYISEGTQSNFHIDRFHIYHLLHRILIPLHDNYTYEWIVDEKIVSYKPELGEVLLFNNMVPHRFISSNNEKREAIYLDLYDPLVEAILADLKGNYSHENGLLEKKYI